MQPAQARLYRPGINLRRVRSPDAPKMTNRQESPVGSGSSENFSSGLTSMTADKTFLLFGTDEIRRHESGQGCALFHRTPEDWDGFRALWARPAVPAGIQW